jgi:hypothetical protein
VHPERDEPQIGAQRAFLCGHRRDLPWWIATARVVIIATSRSAMWL